MIFRIENASSDLSDSSHKLEWLEEEVSENMEILLCAIEIFKKLLEIDAEVCCKNIIKAKK